MNKKYIVCVDDEPLVLESLLRELEPEFSGEFEVETAENGTEALEILEDVLKTGDEAPVAVVDYIMPNMRGDELLAEMHKISPDTRKIMLTGQATMSGVTNAVNSAELYRYISKPWLKSDLVLTVREAAKSYEMKRELIARNKELKRANEKLSKLDSAKSYFIGLLSHELNTPLIGINGNAKLIKSLVEDDDVYRCCDDILESENRLRKIADLSLLITKLRSGKYAPKTYKESVYGLIEDACAGAAEAADAKKITLARNCDEAENKTIDADYSLILKVFQIVLENAVKFSPKNSTIEISAGRLGGRLYAEIKDSGKGFSKNALDNVFEVFSSGELMSHSEGAGLSLAAAKAIMQAHNFDIAAANDESGGAVITLRF